MLLNTRVFVDGWFAIGWTKSGKVKWLNRVSMPFFFQLIQFFTVATLSLISVTAMFNSSASSPPGLVLLDSSLAALLSSHVFTCVRTGSGAAVCTPI